MAGMTRWRCGSMAARGARAGGRAGAAVVASRVPAKVLVATVLFAISLPAFYQQTLGDAVSDIPYHFIDITDTKLTRSHSCPCSSRGTAPARSELTWPAERKHLHRSGTRGKAPWTGPTGSSQRGTADPPPPPAG